MVKEYSTVHHIGVPWHTRSMRVEVILKAFLAITVKLCKVGMLLTCPVATKVIYEEYIIMIFSIFETKYGRLIIFPLIPG